MTAARDDRARVVALAGGKGGVGTSLLTANLAIHLARQGREVVLVDLAPGGAVLHEYVGLRRPARDLGERLADHGPPLPDLLTTGGIPNLQLLAGVARAVRRGPLPSGFGARIIEEVRSLPCDFVLVDAGSGRDAAVRETAAAADATLLVSTPEPLAVRAALALQGAVLETLMRHALGDNDARPRTKMLANKGMRAVLAAMKPKGQAREKTLAALRGHGFGLLLNQVRTASETESAARIGAVLSMMQAVIVDPVLTLEYDLSALQAVAERAVLSQRYPNAPVVRTLEKAAFCLLSPAASSRGKKNRYAALDTWHHYRLLALDPKASPREVQRHYERLRPPFLPDGEAEAIASPATLEAVAAQIETAYRTLIFLENRREYDGELVRAGILTHEDIRRHEATATAAGEDIPDLPARAAPSTAVRGAATPLTARAERDLPRVSDSESGGRQAAATRDGEGGRPSREPAGNGVAQGIRAGADEGEADPGGLSPAATSAETAGAAAETRAPAAASEEATAESTGDTLSTIADVFENGPPDRYTGAVLRELRQRRRLDLDKIAAVTKIRTHHIVSIENEDYSELPVAVFVKGFVREYARCLDLDADRVVKDYMDGYQAWKQERT